MSVLAALAGRPVFAPDQASFVRVYGHLFEHSPWVVERAWALAPFADAAALFTAFQAVIDAAGEAHQLSLARAHPELADRLAIAQGDLTADSAAEQAGAGLDRLTGDQYETFSALNRAYRDRFGFPFIICVRLHDLAGVEAAMRRRLASSAEVERREAMTQVGLIAGLRLADLEPPAGLEAHEARVRHDLDCLAFPGPWLAPRTGPAGEPVFDVIIVGAGQCGLAAAFGLMREGVRNFIVLDENPEGAEGPWETYARMITLRTPKHLTPIDFGIPSLTCRAWWEAQYGRRSWDDLGKIPRGDWMRYLRWYRRVLGIPVRNDARVERTEPMGDGLHRVSVAGAAALTARKVILATGIQGGGEWHTPAFIRDALAAHRYGHTADAIDFARLEGKRIGILGGGASAFDNAQHALGCGAGSVDVFVRRGDLPRVNPIRHLERSGILRHFPLLDDASKYRVIDHFLRLNQPPTNDTFARATAFPNFKLHLGAGWDAVSETDDGVRVETPVGVFEFDYLILSTGIRNDVALRPELSAVGDDILLWRDRYAAPPGAANDVIDDHPYLGPSFELTGRSPAGEARVHGLFVFNYSALASLGLSASALSGLRPALPRLVSGVTGQLFLDRRDALLEDYLNYDDVEFEGRWQAS
ncbi:MAG TPA: 2-oxo-4-hydroxy-4-carboxy-5-ureidoimidazoline decarboxylase [Caulobacteraceae bacterium]|nr:2-oxo-4-hydroxy-4-carboxy-5-ureidoimidazoline decarboxylase [Caulobacteraceae bacterium]